MGNGSPKGARAGLLAALVLAGMLHGPAAAAPADSLAIAADVAEHAGPRGMPVPGADRFQHATLSLTLGLGIGIASRSPALALGGTLGLGLAKELRDRRVTRFDPLDLAADLVGAAAAAVLVHQLVR